MLNAIPVTKSYINAIISNMSSILMIIGWFDQFSFI